MRGLFFLAALLPPELEEQINHFKRDFAENFAAPYALNTPGNIPFTNTFHANDVRLQKLVPELNNIFSDFLPFNAEIRNFGSLPVGFTIFAAIRNPEDFQALREGLFLFRTQKNLLKPETIQSRTFMPHIPVGQRDLKEEYFVAAWRKYSAIRFSANFLIDKIYLMQHRKKWRAAYEFPLLGLGKDRGKQLNLF